MRILVALIAVFMVSGAVAQKKAVGPAPVGIGATCTITCEVGYAPAPSCFGMCKDPKTGETQKVQCKIPPKQRLSDPDEVTLAELEEVCGIQTGDGFDT